MDEQYKLSGDLTSKFEDFEFPPREEVWAGIEDSTILASKFEDFEYAPNSRVWTGIEAELYPRKNRFAVYGWAAAACIALFLGTSLWFRIGAGGEKTLADESASLNPALMPGKIPPAFVYKNDCEPEKAPAPAPVADIRNPQPFNTAQAHSKKNSQPVKFVVDSPDRPLKSPSNAFPEAEKLSANAEIPKQEVPKTKNENQISDLIREMRDEIRSPKVVLAPDPDTLPNFDLELPFPEHRKKRLKLETQIGSGVSPVYASNYIPAREDFFDVQNNPAGANGFESFPLTSSDYLDKYGSTPRENFKTPIVLGGMVNLGLSKRWSLGTGLVYTRIFSSAEYDNQTWKSSSKINRQYLGIPLTAFFDLFQFRRYDLFVSGGGQFDFGLNQIRNTRDENNGTQIANTTFTTPIGNQASANLGLGLDYHLGKKTSLYFQGSASHYFYLSHYTLWAGKLVWPSLQAGFRLNL